ncbi:MAG: restriction endonuclease subunit S, partial [Rhodothermaceae bacterium]|nr:restriction endonuclease subunit S [Rhodothermaceae bacterium]MXX59572.1 restriction endonuclease subunit S [Rhodothermaceae bacterium]
MNKIERLIRDLCPDGVALTELGKVATYTRGISYKKTDEQLDGSIKVLRSNNITLVSNTLNFDDVKSVSKVVRIRPDQWLKNADILISAASGSKAHVGKVAYISHNNVGYSFGAFMAVIRTDRMLLNPKFLYYLLSGRSFEKYLQTALQFTTIKNLNAGIIKGFTIPIPPLQVQHEIVRILDTFSELEAEL